MEMFHRIFSNRNRSVYIIVLNLDLYIPFTIHITLQSNHHFFLKSKF